MNKIITDLNEIIQELASYKDYDRQKIDLILLKTAEIDKSWSGSILSYQCNVYYRNFEIPPKNAYFSMEWGIQLHPMMEEFQQYASNYFPKEGSIGDWVIYSDEEIMNFLLTGVDKNNLTSFMEKSEQVYERFLQLKDKVKSLIYAFNIKKLNPYLKNLVNEIEELDAINADVFCKFYITKFGKKLSTRDFNVRKITISPPLHIKLQSRIIQSLSEFDCIEKLEGLLIKIRDHLLKYPKNEAEKEKAMTAKFHIQNMQGFVGNISGGNMQQNIHDGIHIETNNFDQLADVLSKNGIPFSELAALQKAIDLDEKPNEKNKFGTNVSKWIDNIISKVSSGAINVSLNTISGLLTNAISKYYGLS